MTRRFTENGKQAEHTGIYHVPADFADQSGGIVRSAVITMGLMAIGFVANTVPTEKVVSGIRSIMIFSPAIASAIAAVIFYFGYRIEDKDVLKMQDDIGGRTKINS